MDKTCGIVADLIPLYLDGACSGESRALVEEHTARCPACQKLLTDMGDGPAEPAAEQVLRQTARRFGRQAALRAAGAAAIVLYWLVWLWQNALAEVGNYRWFSYTFHEAYTLGYLLVPLLTLIWLAVLLARTARRRTWRKNGAMLAVLAVLLAAQAGYLWDQARLVHVTGWSQVVSVPDEYHIVIQGDEGQVTLATTPLVANLVRTDGTVYGFSYDSRRDSPDQGRLTFVHGIAEP
ncbi:zf-HC2 domain-containing protein [Intestinimonas massiliensis (ex Afouda et al. 2020)]|uniref:zf-HC2 domain-containing protein n=1 Tax=Intestinimonas massiliensis (ex Afouda et al. 2020) TaxID=1673721 RepID=UPI001030B620|nr:zf-HC2 domain-containing protein [Intestinimonas massiliensis (ex Afouda et al. 2020)]